VTKVEKLGGFRLRLTFSDVTVGERYFSELVAETGMMIEPLRGPGVLRPRVHRLRRARLVNGFDLVVCRLTSDRRQNILF
jgi:hypothetical protein